MDKSAHLFKHKIRHILDFLNAKLKLNDQG